MDASSSLDVALGLVRLVKSYAQYEANEFRLRHLFEMKTAVGACRPV
jgi:hypothetical protein